MNDFNASFLQLLGIPERDTLSTQFCPGVGTAHHQQTAAQLRPNTKDHYHWNSSYNTVYVTAVRPTGCCSQDL